MLASNTYVRLNDRGHSLPSLYSAQLADPAVAAIQHRRRQLHDRLCESLMQMPTWAPEAFSRLHVVCTLDKHMQKLAALNAQALDVVRNWKPLPAQHHMGHSVHYSFGHIMHQQNAMPLPQRSALEVLLSQAAADPALATRLETELWPHLTEQKREAELALAQAIWRCYQSEDAAFGQAVMDAMAAGKMASAGSMPATLREDRQLVTWLMDVRKTRGMSADLSDVILAGLDEKAIQRQGDMSASVMLAAWMGALAEEGHVDKVRAFLARVDAKLLGEGDARARLLRRASTNRGRDARVMVYVQTLQHAMKAPELTVAIFKKAQEDGLLEGEHNPFAHMLSVSEYVEGWIDSGNTEAVQTFLSTTHWLGAAAAFEDYKVGDRRSAYEEFVQEISYSEPNNAKVRTELTAWLSKHPESFGRDLILGLMQSSSSERRQLTLSVIARYEPELAALDEAQLLQLRDLLKARLGSVRRALNGQDELVAQGAAWLLGLESVDAADRVALFLKAKRMHDLDLHGASQVAREAGALLNATLADSPAQAQAIYEHGLKLVDTPDLRRQNYHGCGDAENYWLSELTRYSTDAGEGFAWFILGQLHRTPHTFTLLCKGSNYFLSSHVETFTRHRRASSISQTLAFVDALPERCPDLNPHLAIDLWIKMLYQYHPRSFYQPLWRELQKKKGNAAAEAMAQALAVAYVRKYWGGKAMDAQIKALLNRAQDTSLSVQERLHAGAAFGEWLPWERLAKEGHPEVVLELLEACDPDVHKPDLWIGLARWAWIVHAQMTTEQQRRVAECLRLPLDRAVRDNGWYYKGEPAGLAVLWMHFMLATDQPGWKHYLQLRECDFSEKMLGSYELWLTLLKSGDLDFMAQQMRHLPRKMVADGAFFKKSLLGSDRDLVRLDRSVFETNMQALKPRVDLSGWLVLQSACYGASDKPVGRPSDETLLAMGKDLNAMPDTQAKLQKAVVYHLSDEGVWHLTALPALKRLMDKQIGPPGGKVQSDAYQGVIAHAVAGALLQGEVDMVQAWWDRVKVSSDNKMALRHFDTGVFYALAKKWSNQGKYPYAAENFAPDLSVDDARRMADLALDVVVTQITSGDSYYGDLLGPALALAASVDYLDHVAAWYQTLSPEIQKKWVLNEKRMRGRCQGFMIAAMNNRLRHHPLFADRYQICKRLFTHPLLRDTVLVKTDPLELASRRKLLTQEEQDAMYSAVAACHSELALMKTHMARFRRQLEAGDSAAVLAGVARLAELEGIPLEERCQLQHFQLAADVLAGTKAYADVQAQWQSKMPYALSDADQKAYAKIKRWPRTQLAKERASLLELLEQAHE